MKYLDIAIANETIKTTDIKGRDYAEVNQRIKAFRMVYPEGTIITELLSNENGICIFRAVVSNDEGKVIGTGTAYEKEDSSFINKTSYIENCETSAVGRALGMCGFGIDVSVASAEEVANAIQNQEVTQEEADSYTLDFGKYKGKTIKEINNEDKKYMKWLLENTKNERLLKIMSLSLGIDVPTKEKMQLLCDMQDIAMDKNIDIEEILTKFKVESLSDMSTEQMKKCIIAMQKKEV